MELVGALDVELAPNGAHRYWKVFASRPDAARSPLHPKSSRRRQRANALPSSGTATFTSFDAASNAHVRSTCYLTERQRALSIAARRAAQPSAHVRRGVRPASLDRAEHLAKCDEPGRPSVMPCVLRLEVAPTIAALRISPRYSVAEHRSSITPRPP